MTLDLSPEAAVLRARVLDELARVEGHIALAGRLNGTDAKQQLRLAHSDQRRAVLDDASEFLLTKEPFLLREFADGDDVDPSAIDPVVIPVRTPLEADLFRYATLQWSVPVSSGYGRRTRFLVKDRSNDKLMAIFALGDPVIAQSSRDQVIGWDTQQRNKRLYQCYDAFVLGAVEPYRQLLAGKLVALLAISNETREFLTRKYEGNTTEIRKEVKDPTPALITTSSALGRSSIYNRLTFDGRLMFHSVGFTKGFGHFQFSNELFAALRDFVREAAEADASQEKRVQASSYGSGPNWRFRVLRNALELLQIPKDTMQHNVRREVFVAPVAHNWDSYLRGDADELDLMDLPAAEIGRYYRERWAIGRADRFPGYKLWRKEDGSLLSDLSVRPNQQLSFGQAGPAPGSISMRPFEMRVGADQVLFRSETIGRTVQDGSAYLSQVTGPGLGMTVADIQWANGERELRGWSRHESPELFDQVVSRLRIGVYPSESFERMSVMELRLPGVARDGGRATVRKTSLDELDEFFGFDVVEAFDPFEAVVGTRASLLRDDGPRRTELCVAFPSENMAVPAFVWAYIRPIALGVVNLSDFPKVGPPTEARRAPART